jgi:hypothetical protein
MIPMPSNVVPVMPNSAVTLPSKSPATDTIVPPPVPFRETYAGGALAGAVGTALLGALIATVTGSTAMTGAKYGAALGAAAGAYNVFVKRAKGDRSSPRLSHTVATR